MTAPHPIPPELDDAVPDVGSKGWIGIELDRSTDWDQVGELVEDSYRAIAPKTLVSELDRR